MKANEAVVISEQVLRVILRDIPGELRERLIRENTQPLDVIVANAYDASTLDSIPTNDSIYRDGNDYVNRVEI